jgi:hypothetical protein
VNPASRLREWFSRLLKREDQLLILLSLVIRTAGRPGRGRIHRDHGPSGHAFLSAGLRGLAARADARPTKRWRCRMESFSPQASLASNWLGPDRCGQASRTGERKSGAPLGRCVGLHAVGFVPLRPFRPPPFAGARADGGRRGGCPAGREPGEYPATTWHRDVARYSRCVRNKKAVLVPAI